MVGSTGVIPVVVFEVETAYGRMQRATSRLVPCASGSIPVPPNKVVFLGGTLHWY